MNEFDGGERERKGINREMFIIRFKAYSGLRKERNYPAVVAK